MGRTPSWVHTSTSLWPEQQRGEIEAQVQVSVSRLEVVRPRSWVKYAGENRRRGSIAKSPAKVVLEGFAEFSDLA